VLPLAGGPSRLEPRWGDDPGSISRQYPKSNREFDDSGSGIGGLNESVAAQTVDDARRVPSADAKPVRISPSLEWSRPPAASRFRIRWGVFEGAVALRPGGRQRVPRPANRDPGDAPSSSSSGMADVDGHRM